MTGYVKDYTSNKTKNGLSEYDVMKLEKKKKKKKKTKDMYGNKIFDPGPIKKKKSAFQ